MSRDQAISEHKPKSVVYKYISTNVGLGINGPLYCICMEESRVGFFVVVVFGTTKPV